MSCLYVCLSVCRMYVCMYVCQLARPELQLLLSEQDASKADRRFQVKVLELLQQSEAGEPKRAPCWTSSLLRIANLTRSAISQPASQPGNLSRDYQTITTVVFTAAAAAKTNTPTSTSTTISTSIYYLLPPTATTTTTAARLLLLVQLLTITYYGLLLLLLLLPSP